MALLHIPLDQIEEAQLQNLIKGQAVETRDIEYKRETYGNRDSDAGEFLADVSSFANTSGGDIIIGMAAKSGVPTNIVPIPVEAADSEKLRLENIARSGLQPRIFGLDFRAIPVARGAVIITRIPRSYNSPHRIVRQGPGQNRFYARSSAGKYEPNVDELRSLFVRAPRLAERIRDFRLDRVAKIAAGDTPVRLQEQNAIIVHVIPFSAFDKRLSLPLDPQSALYLNFPPLGSSHPQNARINVDGLLTLSNVEQNAPAQRAYTQLFHSGIVEAAASILFGDGTKGSPLRATSLQTEITIVRYSHVYLKKLLALGGTPPFAMLVSFIGVKGAPYRFTPIQGAGYDWDYETGILDRDQFHFSELVIEDIPDDQCEYAKFLRPLFDEIANAAGRASAVSFDDAGAFRYSIR
jgi:hypothetical protein